MSANRRAGMDWTVRTVAIAAAVSIISFLFSLALASAGVWPDWAYSHFIFGGLSGATAVHRMHPDRPITVLLVFGTVLSVLLGVGAFLFGWFVMGESI